MATKPRRPGPKNKVPDWEKKRRVSFDPKDLADDMDPYAYWWPRPEKGKSVAVGARIDADEKAVISDLIAHREGPWADFSDYMRCALGYYTQLISSTVKTKRFRDAMRVQNIRLATIRTLKKLTDTEDLLTSAYDAVTQLCDRGCAEDAKDLLLCLKGDWEQLGEDQNSLRRMYEEFFDKSRVKRILRG